MTSINNTLVLSALSARVENDANIQAGFIALAESCISLSKKEIVEAVEVRDVFIHPAMARAHLRQAVAWVHEFTPIRVKFKKNGQFDKISFAKTPVWDIEGMSASNWYDYEAVRTTSTARADKIRAIKALARETGMLGFESKNLLGSIEAIRALVNSADFIISIQECMESEKFAEWADKRTADIAKTKAEAPKINAEIAELFKNVA